MIPDAAAAVSSLAPTWSPPSCCATPSPVSGTASPPWSPAPTRLRPGRAAWLTAPGGTRPARCPSLGRSQTPILNPADQQCRVRRLENHRKKGQKDVAGWME